MNYVILYSQYLVYLKLFVPVKELLIIKQVKEMMKSVFNVIIRNAKKLQCLSENILDVTKIESQSLILNKERFNLSDIISNTIEDCKSQIEKVGKQKSISLLYKSKNKNKNVISKSKILF